MLGSQSEKGQLKQEVEGMERFCKDVVEITTSQAKEINALQKTNLELFAWVEEAKSIDVRVKNPRCDKQLNRHFFVMLVLSCYSILFSMSLFQRVCFCHIVHYQ